jgi:hypothetical protein
MMMGVEQSVERELRGAIEVFGENLLQRHYVHHNQHMTVPGFKSGPPPWEAGE